MRRWVHRMLEEMNETNVFLGLWMVVSPWVLGFAHAQSAAARLAWVIGAALFLFGMGAAELSDFAQQSATLALGLLLLIAPWAASFSSEEVAAFNSLLIGAFAGVVALHAMHRDRPISERLRDIQEQLRERLRELTGRSHLGH